MATYKFLYKNPEIHTDSPISYYAVSEETIVTQKLSRTYDGYGQLVGSYNAGDSLTLNSEKAVEVANTVCEKQESDTRFELGSYVSGYDHNDVYDEIYSALQDLEESTNDQENDWTDQSIECESFDYWDGSNWKTIIVEIAPEYGTNDYILVDDEELEKELNQAIEECEFVKEGTGCKFYEFEDWTVEESFWQGVWAEKIIYDKKNSDSYDEIEDRYL